MKIGDIITLGTYFKTRVTYGEYTVEPIEWQVLDIKDGKALLLSRYALDGGIPYEKVRRDTSWGECNIRAWLNEAFYKVAFDEVDRRKIACVTIPADARNSLSFASRDRIFLLSIGEVGSYLSVEDSACHPTDYANDRTALLTSTDGRCAWWLRSAGVDASWAALVDEDGVINDEGFMANRSFFGIRPAMWIYEDEGELTDEDYTKRSFAELNAGLDEARAMLDELKRKRSENK
ncbi:MAG: hypothetical protein IJF38_07800 [Clostridia bacterium]|nr:hypothetical protein [Clostridia bacterium]